MICLIILIGILILNLCLANYPSSNKDINRDSFRNLEETPLLSWDIKWTDNGNPVCTETSNQDHFQICSDGTGGAIITWDQYSVATGTDVYVQRINSTGDTQWCGSLYWDF